MIHYVSSDANLTFSGVVRILCQRMPDTWPVTTIRKSDAQYPPLLAQVHDAPDTLYCRGNTALLASRCFGVVGTRAMTSYGKDAATRLAGELSGAGFTIVSGLALGIDAIAHRTALDASGPTVAVLGGGVDDASIHPLSNVPLAKRILESGGLVVSEYPVGFTPRPSTFPQRNRIISGLSVGVLVVEADEQSGSLITAKCALDQNRDVFAVPGSIFSQRTRGTHLLIQQGAKLVTSVRDILDEYGQQGELDIATADVSTQNPTEARILAILRESGAAHIDQLIAAVGCSAPEALAAVSMLELRGAVKHAGDGTYRTS